jgi:hypothetical protein
MKIIPEPEVDYWYRVSTVDVRNIIWQRFTTIEPEPWRTIEMSDEENLVHRHAGVFTEHGADVI